MIRFSLILTLYILLIPSILAQCIERPYPNNPEIKISVKCSTINEPKKSKSDLNFQVGDSMFKIQFTCTSTNAARCTKAESTFEEAGRIISSTLELNSIIIIDAKFREIDEDGLLGAAGAFRTMPLKDDDGFERLYPQSLVKQFQLASHPEFSPVDIVADFNALIPFWFEGDPPITEDQTGFLELVLHELMHGLGFSSSWLDYFPEAVNPDIIGLTDGNGDIDPLAKVTFGGFIESAFDKYLILLPDNKSISSYIPELNKFAMGPGSVFANVDDFSNQFLASPQYLIAKEVYNYTVTPKAIIFKPSASDNEEDISYLETSLNPFRRGSSVSHTDRLTYENTSEFVMTYVQVQGRTLSDNISVGGNYTGGAIGYKLRRILESLGYATKENPTPSGPSPPTPSKNESVSNEASSSSKTFVVRMMMISFIMGLVHLF